MIKDFEQIRMQYFPESIFIIALDLAPQASRRYRFCFVSVHATSKFRSILREIVKVFSSLMLCQVTELSFGGRRSPTFRCGKTSGTFVEFGMPGDPLKLEAVLQKYIPPFILESASGKSLQLRIQELPSRSVSYIFFEIILGEWAGIPAHLAERVPEQSLLCPSGDMNFYTPFTSWGPPVHIQPKVKTFDWENSESVSLHLSFAHLT